MCEGYRFVQCRSETDAVYKQVIALEKKCFSKADSWRGDMALELRRRNTFIICMTMHADQHVLAYMLYSIHSLAAHIARLAVCPLHRRAGHAKRLIQHVTRELQRARRISTFSLHVAAVNEPALALYKASGFKEDAFLQDYYAPGRHAHRLMLELQ